MHIVRPLGAGRRTRLEPGTRQGFNPWGLVWLFQDFEAADTAQVPQLLSDHPDNPHRVDALKRHFAQNGSVFGSFSADARTAKPFAVPKDAGEAFLR